jgi:hypothetical protein
VPQRVEAVLGTPGRPDDARLDLDRIAHNFDGHLRIGQPPIS